MKPSGIGAEPGPFRTRAKVIAYVIAWFLALLATNPTGTLWSLGWMFPLGLFAIFYPPALRDGGWGGLLLCAGIYIVHAVFYFRSRTRRSTILWFAILIIVLTCNVAGCRSMLNPH